MRSLPSHVPADFLEPGRNPGERWRFDGIPLVEFIGEGGFALVFRSGSGQVVKVLHPRKLADPTAHERMRREGDVLRRIDHPNVVSLLGRGLRPQGASQTRTPYLLLEFVEGETLRDLMDDRLNRGGSFTIAEVEKYATELISGLAALHDQGCWHRDLKPENIKISADGSVKILDLGLVLPRSAARISRNLHGVPEAVGSYGYSAPEQLHWQPSSQSDIFSLGCILYELTTGLKPFGDGRAATDRILDPNYSPSPPIEINATCPLWLSNLIASALNKQPTSRCRSARYLLASLLHFSQFGEGYRRGFRVLRTKMHRKRRRKSISTLIGHCREVDASLEESIYQLLTLVDEISLFEGRLDLSLEEARGIAGSFNDLVSEIVVTITPTASSITTRRRRPTLDKEVYDSERIMNDISVSANKFCEGLEEWVGSQSKNDDRLHMEQRLRQRVAEFVNQLVEHHTRLLRLEIWLREWLDSLQASRLEKAIAYTSNAIRRLWRRLTLNAPRSTG